MDKPIRVIHIFTPAFGYSFSGQTFVLRELFRKWSHQEIILSWYGTSYNFLSENELGKNALFTKNIRNTRLSRIIYNFKLWFNLIRRKNEYDIIQVHNLGWGGLIAPMIAHCVGKKAIYLMSLFGSDNPGALLSERAGNLKLNLFKKYDGVIGLSPSLVDDCRKYNFHSKLVVIPNFLSFDPLTVANESERMRIRHTMGISENTTILLFVGSVIKRKGFDLLVSSFIKLSKKYKNLRLIVVGPHKCSENPRVDESFVKQQQEVLKKAGLHEKVDWVGMINDQTILAGFYRAADIFVFPSRAEGQGNVILEAMAAGLPIVSTHLVGVTDMMIEKDQQGILIEKDDMEGFTKAIEMLLVNEELRFKMGNLGRMKVITDYSFTMYAQKLSDFYMSVARNS